MQFSQPPRDDALLRRHHPSLLPIALRTEGEDDCVGYIADARFLRGNARLEPITDKTRFKLRLKSGSFKAESPHFYLLRCPTWHSSALSDLT
jgi:hypothetical protein